MRWSSYCYILGVHAALLVSALALLAAPQQQPPAQPAASPNSTPAASAQPTASPPQQEFFVLIDPSHGGDDKGAVFSPRLMEKDVTLALARVLRKQLEEREIPVRLLRDSDATISLDHRAELCNQQRPGLYIALHAGTIGSGVRVYTTMAAVREQPVGSFLPWGSAQLRSLQRSSAIASEITQELKKKELKAANLQAFLRPLDNVVSPAIAIEVAADHGDLRLLDNLRQQDAIASAIASAVAEKRSHPGGPR